MVANYWLTSTGELAGMMKHYADNVFQRVKNRNAMV